MRTLLYSYNNVHSFLVNRCSCIRKLKTSTFLTVVIYVLPSCRKMSCHFVKIYNLSLSLCTLIRQRRLVVSKEESLQIFPGTIAEAKGQRKELKMLP